MTYSFAKMEATEKPANWNQPGWHQDERTVVEVYRNADTGEVILTVVEPS